MSKREEAWLAHSKAMQEFDLQFSQGVIAGMDEVGRGPLAGDVVAAVVVMPREPLLPRIDDSKKLSEKARLDIALQIMEAALFVKIGKASPEEIDKYNILVATKMAMERAVVGLKADLVLVDALQGLNIDFAIKSIIKGDAKSYNIAAASVVAKVMRDGDMIVKAEQYPMYDFANNKGYGTKKHIEALKEYGPCPIHRKSFIGNFVKP